jgi:hypothetical protein
MRVGIPKRLASGCSRPGSRMAVAMGSHLKQSSRHCVSALTRRHRCSAARTRSLEALATMTTPATAFVRATPTRWASATGIMSPSAWCTRRGPNRANPPSVKLDYYPRS